VVLFVFMNEQLPKITGQAIRQAREAVHAARELTHVGLTTSRADDPEAGRQTTGHVDERFVRAAERKRATWCTVLGTVMAIYAAVMFTRVERLAAGLGWPLTFVLLAAALITVFTVGGKVHTPKPANLFAIGRPIRSRAAGHLDDAKAILAEAGQILAGACPFDPTVIHPDPWAARSAPRQARANPAFVDPYQLGVLHTPVTEHVPLWRRPRLWTVLGAALVILIGLAVIATLLHL